jgi:hypothetical protein
MILALEILGLIAAFALGIWWGLPGRYTQTADDIEEIMEQGGQRRRRAQRIFTPLAWVQRNVRARRSHDRAGGGGRRGFRIERPGDR